MFFALAKTYCALARVFLPKLNFTALNFRISPEQGQGGVYNSYTHSQVVVLRRLLISDLHLNEARPELNRQFIRMLEQDWRNYDEILILGDLFHAWIGDDDDSDWLSPVLDAMQQCCASGVRMGVQFGNHDFLYGDKFCSRSGARILDEYLPLSLGGRDALLMHGDQLCTLDTDYQEYRARVHGAEWQAEFLARSLSERRDLVQGLRRDSQKQTALKPSDIMDVSPDEVVRVMQQYDTRLLIHGHTHRPAVHPLSVDGQPAQRMVLGSWDEHGWCIEASDDSLELLRFELD